MARGLMGIALGLPGKSMPVKAKPGKRRPTEADPDEDADGDLRPEDDLDDDAGTGRPGDDADSPEDDGPETDGGDEYGEGSHATADQERCARDLAKAYDRGDYRGMAEAILAITRGE